MAKSRGKTVRPSIDDIARESGLSRATVLRVLNGRSGVHARTREHVERVVTKLTADHPPEATRPVIDFALRLDSGMMSQVLALSDCLGNRPHQFHDLHQKSDHQVLDIVRELCADTTRPLVLTVKSKPEITAELLKARRRGKIVIALIAELASEARDSFVGIDNRAAGATAAYLIGNALGGRPTAVGFILGDHLYRCHEDREIGFRSTLRAQFPRIAVVGEAVGQDNTLVTRAAVQKFLYDHPGIAALYNVSGGNDGLAEAVAEVGRTQDVLVVIHEVNDITVPLLRAGKVNFLISQDPRDLLTEAVKQIDLLRSQRVNEVLVDFSVHTAFNIPTYGHLPLV
jgi:LacI family transcriptional regulator